MNLTEQQTRLIERVVNVFETGKPEGRYDAVTVANDGPHGIRQISYGKCQVTEYGSLRELISQYLLLIATTLNEVPELDLVAEASLHSYRDKIGAVPLSYDIEFRRILSSLGRNSKLMRLTQDKFFYDDYFAPALAWARIEKFQYPLSMLVIYDSFIHSGSILWSIRSQFPELTPNGVNFRPDAKAEKAWIRAYVDARHHWLLTHPIKILHKTTYRTACFQQQIEDDNWKLVTMPIWANGVPVGYETPRQ